MIELGHLHKDPGFEQLLITAARNTFQIQNARSGSGRTSTPPFGSSAVKLATLDRDRSHQTDKPLNLNTAWYYAYPFRCHYSGEPLPDKCSITCATQRLIVLKGTCLGLRSKSQLRLRSSMPHSGCPPVTCKLTCKLA